MLGAIARLGSEFDYILPIASTLDRSWVKQQAESSGVAGVVVSALRLVSDAREALFHGRASVVASGTATVQAALIGNPFIVVYSVSPLTFKLAKRLVRYPPEVWPSGESDAHGNLPIAMVNLIAGRRIVPELIQEQFTPANVANSLRPLLDDTSERAAMIVDLAEVRSRLLPAAGIGSISQVADAVDSLLDPSFVERGRIPAASV
jgi:lipid-A-disaccharide synthase